MEWFWGNEFSSSEALFWQWGDWSRCPPRSCLTFSKCIVTVTLPYWRSSEPSDLSIKGFVTCAMSFSQSWFISPALFGHPLLRACPWPDAVLTELCSVSGALTAAGPWPGCPLTSWQGFFPDSWILLSINNSSDFLSVLKLAHTYDRKVETLGNFIEENLNYSQFHHFPDSHY